MLSTMNLRKGFTLAEILIALGILAIGMAMVAAVFPAAMLLNKSSRNATIGNIICENGLGLSQMALTTKIVDGQTTPETLLVYADNMHEMVDDVDGDGKDEPTLTRGEQQYPTRNPKDKGKSRTGFVMMARKVADADSTYQLITVAYRKTDKDNTVALLPITCKITGREITEASNLRIGTPVINRKTVTVMVEGNPEEKLGFAFVDSINSDGTAGTLDIDPNKRSTMFGSGGKAYVLVEQKNGKSIGIDEMRRSPAIGIMLHLTGLRHDPSPGLGP